MSLTIDVISDVVCPWCYIGKKKLEAALQMFSQNHPNEPAPQVRWHPFQLNPDLDPKGMDRAQYVRDKFGDRGTSVYERVKEVGQEVGIDFAFDQIKRQPNTRKAHSLIGACHDLPMQHRMVQILFDAYFIEAQDLTSDQVLSSLARLAGLDQASIDQALFSSEAIARIDQADQHARSLGVQGVPFFVFNSQLAVSGAQAPETLLGAMSQAISQSQPS
jgi:predicted DsbA family dithiol-disulfide isomerase